MDIHNCPTCGGSLNHVAGLIFNPSQRLIIFDGRARRLSLQQVIIFGALYLLFGHAVQTNHLIQLIWGLDEPNDPEAVIGTLVSQLRRPLIGSGYYIPRAQYRGGYESGSYTLCFDSNRCVQTTT